MGVSFIAYIILAISVTYAFIMPSLDDISALGSEKQKYEEALETVSSIENKKNELLTKFNNISEEEKKEINAILPDSFDFVRIVSEIDAAGARHGISIDDISSKITSSKESSIGEAAAAPARAYESAVISFSFDSSYENFTAFLNELEKSMRILDVRAAKLNAGEKGSYNFSVEVEAYWLK